jgi:biotin carboxyl carrier protein
MKMKIQIKARTIKEIKAYKDQPIKTGNIIATFK